MKRDFLSILFDLRWPPPSFWTTKVRYEIRELLTVAAHIIMRFIERFIDILLGAWNIRPPHPLQLHVFGKISRVRGQDLAFLEDRAATPHRPCSSSNQPLLRYVCDAMS